MGKGAGAFLALVLAAPAEPLDAQHRPPTELTCVVGRIADGDSFRCQDGLRVRLIGIDSPESAQAPYGAAARDALRRLLKPGITVRLETDVAATDHYGRVLAYVWLDSTLVNERMLRDGWAMLYTVPPNLKHVDRFRQTQNEARARGAGLWGQGGFACAPSDFRRQRCLNSP
jgi:micrococcal nuclease